MVMFAPVFQGGGALAGKRRPQRHWLRLPILLPATAAIGA